MRFRIGRRSTGHRRKSLGQSLVEFTIMLPVLLMMLSGLIEFGILLNYYLDVIDAAREAARFAADGDPIRDDAGLPLDPNPQYFLNVQELTKQSLDFASDSRIDWIGTILDPAECGVEIQGDIVITAFSTLGDTVDRRFPTGTGDDGLSMCASHVSNITTAEVNAILSGSPIPNGGLVLVEIYYDYHMVLGLPWIRAFVPDPITLHAYSIMPNVNVEPTPTP
jgi:hypothetical protein